MPNVKCAWKNAPVLGQASEVESVVSELKDPREAARRIASSLERTASPAGVDVDQLCPD